MARRRRYSVVVLVIFLCISPVGLLAQESGEAGRALPLKAEMSGLFSGTRSELYLCADPSVVWRPGLLGVGLGVEFLVGFSQFDMYTVPYLRAEAGWFHFDLGYVLALVRPPVGDGLAGPTVGVAIAPKPFELGYGNLGFDLGFDFGVTEFIDVYGTYAGATEFERIVISTVLSGRVGIGVTYGFQLL